MKLFKFSKTKEKNDVNEKKDLPFWDMTFPITPSEDKTSLSKDLTATGNNIFTGLAYLMPNPDPVLKKLGWNKDVDAYKEILSDPQLYGAIENNRKPGVTSLLWYIDNPEGDEKETEYLKGFIKSLHYKGIYDNLINRVLDTPQFGRMVFGVVWDTVDGKWLPVRIEAMPHHLCKFDYNGNLFISEDGGLTFSAPTHPARYIVLRHKPSLTNPYGEALLSKTFWNVRFKKDGMKLWAIFMEKYGMPWVSASYNPNAIAQSFATDMTSAATLLLKKLSLMARNGVIVFPDGTKVDVTKTGDVSSAEIYEKMIRICDEQNTKLELGHSGATESTSGDKLSNDTTATEVRQQIIDSDKKYPISLFNQLIYWIHQFNFGSTHTPTFNLYKEEEVDMALAERDAKLVPVLQVSELRFSKDYLIKNYGFEDDDLVGGTEPAENKVNAKTKKEFLNYLRPYLNKATSDADFPDQDLIDEVVDEIVAGDDSFENILKAVSGYIDNNENYTDALENLHKLYPHLNTANLQEKMERIMFVSDLIGHFSAKAEIEE
jgi:phage gp29-like protein